MGDNPGLLTYEIDAISIQINDLEKDKIELEQRLRKLESENHNSGNVSVRHKIEVFKIQGLLGETLEKIDQLTNEKDEKSKKVQRLEVKTSNSTMNVKKETTAIDHQTEIRRLEREIAAETEKWKKEKDELIEWVEQRLKAEKEAWEKVKSMNKNDEIKELKKKNKDNEAKILELEARNRELSERFRRLEFQLERKFGESSSRNHSDIWEAANDLRQRDTAIRNFQEQTSTYISKLQQQAGQTTILILGGYDGKEILDKLILLKEDKWIELPLKLPEDNSAHGTIYMEEEIYVFGGDWKEKVNKLDKNLKWIPLADMNQKRWYITNSCLEWNGCIWVFGGSSDVLGDGMLKSIEKYDPKKDKWTEMPPMNQARRKAAAVVWNGKFMVCGGGCDNIGLKSVECFDPESGVWTELDDLPSPLSGHAIVPYGNKLIILGGWRGEATNTVMELSNCDGKQLWKELPSMKTSRYGFSGVVLNGEIYVIGGSDGKNKLVETEIFNGVKWIDGPDLPQKNFYMSAVIIPQHFADSLLNYKL